MSRGGRPRVRLQFDSTVFALRTIAYRSILTELRLYDQIPATPMVAKLDFATQGERDPYRQKAATPEALTG
jgi:hypothetical protein